MAQPQPAPLGPAKTDHSEAAPVKAVKMTAYAFANSYGMSDSESRIAVRRYPNEQHTEVEWYDMFKSDFKLVRELKSVNK